MNITDRIRALFGGKQRDAEYGAATVAVVVATGGDHADDGESPADSGGSGGEPGGDAGGGGDGGGGGGNGGG